ncbi:MAG: ORC-CDC6 family AAA ATPase [Candidatus Cyclobacteriaceae bacterium M2_1C_046]
MIEHELNARPLEYSEVGRKFVVHPEFHKLVNTNNSIVVGPRGSGKTTMLKVLTPEAIKAWIPKNKEEEVIKNSISFLGLYVPLSRIFQDDLEVRYHNSSLSKEFKDNLLFKIYYYNIIEAILELVYFLYKERGVNKKWEQTIAESLRSTLNIEVDYCYKISSLIRAISQIKLQARRDLNSSNYIEKYKYNGEILSSLEPVLKTVNEIFEFSPTKKYALCLDELDVYASAFTAEMVKNLRGGSTNIILKLTLAPVHDIDISQFMDPPQLIHDYDRIYLWPTSVEHNTLKLKDETTESRKKLYLEFAEELANQTIYEITNSKIKLDDLLGDFSYQEVFRHLKSSESDDNFFKELDISLNDKELTSMVFKQLARRQPNLAKFLRTSYGIDINNLDSVRRKIASSSTRKLKQIIFNRVITTKTVDGKPKFRRDVKIQYHGKKLILKSMDGNPRYLKKLMEYLTENIKFKDDKVLKIPINIQAKCLYKVKDLLLQRIDAIPVDSFDDRLSAGILIRQIGNYLSDKLNLSTDWNSTSYPSYVKVPNIREIKGYEDTFRKAINNGALMIIGEVDLAKLNTVKLKELRLNYLLHLEFRIPIRKYYPVSFEKILKIVPSQTNPLFK